MTISGRNDEPASGTGANFPLSPVRRALVLSVFMGLMVVNLLDRQIVAILAEPMRLELGLSDSQIGILSGLVFAIFYSTFALPIGGSPTAMTTSISSPLRRRLEPMTAACGLAGNFIHRSGAYRRCRRQAVSAGAFADSDYFPPERRARAIAIKAGAPIGVFRAGRGRWIAGIMAGGMHSSLSPSPAFCRDSRLLVRPSQRRIRYAKATTLPTKLCRTARTTGAGA